MFGDEMEESKSARKSTHSSRRRREVKNDELDLDAMVSGSTNFDITSVSSSMRAPPPQPQPRRNSKTKENIFDEDGGDGGDGAAAGDSIFGTQSSRTGGGGGGANKPPMKAINGWGEPSSTSNRHRSPKFGRANDLSDSMEKESARESTISKTNRREITEAEELDIPEIPDMEETVEQADMGFSVAEAPDVQVHQIATYKELDKEFFKEKSFQFLEGNIDVNLLHCGLSTEQQIAEEEDVIWDWTKLFTEVVSVLTANENNESKDPFADMTSNGPTTSTQSAPAAVKAAASSTFGDDRADVFEALKQNKSDRRSQNRREIDL